MRIEDEYLKGALKALVGYKVEWNVLDKDNKWEWGVTTLLAEARIKDGVCTYAYGPMLRERLHNPNIYARISLSRACRVTGIRSIGQRFQPKKHPVLVLG